MSICGQLAKPLKDKARSRSRPTVLWAVGELSLPLELESPLSISDRVVLRIRTTQQQPKTRKKAQTAPAVPTTQVNRMKRMTPKMFWMQGKNTPISVPIRADFGVDLPSPSSVAAGIVFE